MKRILGTAFLLLVFSLGMALAAEPDRRAATAIDDYESVIRQIETKKKKHEDLEKKEKSLLDQFDRLAFMQDRKNKELRSLQRERSQTEKAISFQENEMRRLSEQMSITQRHIQARAGALYKISKVGPWAFLLSGENYGDFLRMSTFLYSMIDHDVRLFTTFENQLGQKETLRRKLAADRDRLQEKQVAVRLKKRQIEALKQKEKKALRRVKEEKTSYARVIQDLEKQAEMLGSLVKRLSRPGQKKSRLLSGFPAMRGRLPLPVAGKIEGNGQSRLRGISLKAPLGDVVRAVYGGHVVYAGWFKGYGNLLIIEHGDNFHTVMGHASELLKEKGDWVEAGEPVARVGSTGSLGGPSLYFEIRQNGIPVNPLDWFSGKGRLALK